MRLCVFASLRLCVFSKIENGDIAKTHAIYKILSKSSSVITVNSYFMEEVASLHLLSFPFFQKRRKDAKTQRRFGRILTTHVTCYSPFLALLKGRFGHRYAASIYWSSYFSR